MDNKSENHGMHVKTTVAEDAVPLCPNCLEPCNPLDNYCPNCGSNEAINPLASYMPFVDLRLRIGMIGKLWRKTWEPGTSVIGRVFNIVLILLCYPLILLIGLPVVFYQKIKQSDKHRAQ